ncbi:MAG: ClpXP protease specificity-enhancing factor [Brachymonas sp.]|nr:ClpXP protease specificity-enhancing factor [Brachymonas sp.]
MSAIAPPLTSPKPYLIRAWHEWMSDNGLTPHILVMVDGSVTVPREYVKNNEVVLNVSHDATGSLNLGNDEIRFQARFAGRVREIVVPIERVASIFARENGQGMVFEALLAEDADFDGDAASEGAGPEAGASSATAERSSAHTGLSLVNKSDSAEPPKKPKRPTSNGPDDETPPPAPPSAPKGGGLKVVK